MDTTNSHNQAMTEEDIRMVADTMGVEIKDYQKFEETIRGLDELQQKNTEATNNAQDQARNSQERIEALRRTGVDPEQEQVLTNANQRISRLTQEFQAQMQRQEEKFAEYCVQYENLKTEFAQSQQEVVKAEQELINLKQERKNLDHGLSYFSIAGVKKVFHDGVFATLKKGYEKLYMKGPFDIWKEKSQKNEGIDTKNREIEHKEQDYRNKFNLFEVKWKEERDLDFELHQKGKKILLERFNQRLGEFYKDPTLEKKELLRSAVETFSLRSGMPGMTKHLEELFKQNDARKAANVQPVIDIGEEIDHGQEALEIDKDFLEAQIWLSVVMKKDVADIPEELVQNFTKFLKQVISPNNYQNYLHGSDQFDFMELMTFFVSGELSLDRGEGGKVKNVVYDKKLLVNALDENFIQLFKFCASNKDFQEQRENLSELLKDFAGNDPADFAEFVIQRNIKKKAAPQVESEKDLEIAQLREAAAETAKVQAEKEKEAQMALDKEKAKAEEVVERATKIQAEKEKEIQAAIEKQKADDEKKAEKLVQQKLLDDNRMLLEKLTKVEDQIKSGSTLRQPESAEYKVQVKNELEEERKANREVLEQFMKEMRAMVEKYVSHESPHLPPEPQTIHGKNENQEESNSIPKVNAPALSDEKVVDPQTAPGLQEETADNVLDEAPDSGHQYASPVFYKVFGISKSVGKEFMQIFDEIGSQEPAKAEGISKILRNYEQEIRFLFTGNYLDTKVFSGDLYVKLFNSNFATIIFEQVVQLSRCPEILGALRIRLLQATKSDATLDLFKSQFSGPLNYSLQEWYKQEVIKKVTQNKHIAAAE